MRFTKNTRNKNITQSQLNHPSLLKPSTVCSRQDLGKEHSILLYVTLALNVCQCLSLCRSLCQKWDLLLSSIGVKVNGQFCSDILLSQQMLDAIIPSFITILSFIKTVHRCILRSTQSNCCSATLLTSSLSYGSVTVQSITSLAVRFRESYSSMSIKLQVKTEYIKPVIDWLVW